MKMVPASDSSLLVKLGEEISPDLHGRVLALFRALVAEKDERIRNLHPAYGSVLIDFDPLRLSHEELESRVAGIAGGQGSEQKLEATVVTIPVCYEPEFAPDLGYIAERAGISREEVIRLHSAATYLVYFLGFSPGFAYLGGLPEELAAPRLAMPRKSVPAGSVGIAGKQTGIYPSNSPGGWRLLGRTPLRMFDPQTEPHARLRPGDLVQFWPIDRGAFQRMSEFQ